MTASMEVILDPTRNIWIKRPNPVAQDIISKIFHKSYQLDLTFSGEYNPHFSKEFRWFESDKSCAEDEYIKEGPLYYYRIAPIEDKSYDWFKYIPDGVTILNVSREEAEMHRQYKHLVFGHRNWSKEEQLRESQKQQQLDKDKVLNEFISKLGYGYKIDCAIRRCFSMLFLLPLINRIVKYGEYRQYLQLKAKNDAYEARLIAYEEKKKILSPDEFKKITHPHELIDEIYKPKKFKTLRKIFSSLSG